MSENLQKIIDRVKAGNHSLEDLETITEAIRSGKLVQPSGSRSVGIGGDVTDTSIVSGNQNVLGDLNFSFYGTDHHKVSDRKQKKSNSNSDVFKKVRLHCCKKNLNLYSKIHLLNRQQRDMNSLYVDVYVLERLSSEYYLTVAEILVNNKTNFKDGFDRLAFCKRGKRSSGFEVISEYPRVMVLGKPGSGKSTFLRHLLVACSEGNFWVNYIPVMLELRFIKEINDFNLLNIVHQEFNLEDIEQTKQILNDGRVLILLDGLDEVPSFLHLDVQNIILEFSNKYYKNKFVLTCRTQTTEYIFPTFQAVEIADFNSDQIKYFVRNWFVSSTELSCQETNHSSSFLNKLQSEEYKATAELAVTPLLLSLICLIFNDLKDFPLKRSDLYEQALDLLLKNWDKKKGVERGSVTIYEVLSLEEKKNFLGYIAARKFEKAQYALFQENEICQYISESLQLPYENKESLKSILSLIESQSGLLVKRSHDTYSFLHLTFLEYLTARHFAINSNYLSIFNEYRKTC